MSDTITLKLAAAVSAASLLGLAVMAAGASPAASQEFDCRNAEIASERTICGSDRLSALDERMNALYADLRAASGSKYERADLKSYQRQFLDARDGCGRDAECIKGAYLDQISVLESRLERAYRRSER
ncbi:MAG: lysozyme inhibitor LprI family protein [Hyphomicrobium sp.]|uniref:lysozyme inhibitor LprI family protein n=1 Tax=Hyphomicrobium sp. TaxID=82 RepID=UPI0039E428E5